MRPRAIASRFTRACSFSFGSNGSLAVAIGDQLDGLEQAAAAHIADEGMIAEPLLQPPREIRALHAHVRQQIVAADHPLHGERRRAGERMAHVGVAVLEDARAGGNRLENLLLHQQAPIGAKPPPRPLAIAIRSGAMPSCSQACSVPVRPMPHITSSRMSRMPWRSQISRTRLEVAGHRRDRAQGRADHRLGDEGDDVVAAELFDLGFELVGEARRIGLRRLVGAAAAIFVDRRYMMRLDQQRAELLALPFPAADRERAERDAVIALAPRDEVAALRLARVRRNTAARA